MKLTPSRLVKHNAAVAFPARAVTLAPLHMKNVLSSLGLVLLLSVGAVAAQRPAAEILEYGIYSGGHKESVPDTNAPTGQLLIGGPVRLEKKTDQIPAKLKTKFGFRFVVHSQPENAQVKLHFVYLFPEMKDPNSDQKLKRYETDAFAKAEDKNPQMLWDFTEPHELVAGEWTFQVFRGEDKLLEKKFEVVKADSK
jgi:hypothetical protein